MTITCGVDWAENHHDAAVMDEHGTVLGRTRIDTGPAGFAQLQTLIAEHGGSAEDTAVAIETDKNLLVVALTAAGYTVHAINPRAVARYRERWGQAGGKSDAADAAILADILRTDRHVHRPLPRLSEQALAVRALARQHQEAIWARDQTISRLRSVLLDFYPSALQAFPKLKHRAAMTILTAAPTPTAGRKLTDSQIQRLLKKAGRRNDPTLVAAIRTALHSPTLARPGAVEEALGRVVGGLTAIISAMLDTVATLESTLSQALAEHPDAEVLRSVPGVGKVIGARLLAEIGDDPERFESASAIRSFAGTAPVTIASGRSRYVKARRVRNKRLADAAHWWAFAALTWSSGAREFYDGRRARGENHNAALRTLANKLIGRLWWCLKQHQPWDETTAWPEHRRPTAKAA